MRRHSEVGYNYDMQPFECEDAGIRDLTPKGRDERDGPMAWVRHHDRYEPVSPVKSTLPAGSCCHTQA